MGINNPHDEHERFEEEARRFGLGERPPYPLAEKETAGQRDLSRRFVQSYPHGLEEVDVLHCMDGFTNAEIYHIAMATEALMLSSFCRGQCRECGLSAKPYSKENRQVFALEPLIRFMERYRMGGGLGKLMLYDASDPLDYPWLLQLLDYLESDDNYREIKVMTSCPRGAEELLQHLLKREPKKMQLMLSRLPSTEARLRESGALDMVIDDTRRRMEDYCCQGFDVAQRYKYTEPEPIGRNHFKGCLSSGFYCGDMMVLTPHLGPCCAEYHIASDMYPDERRLVPVREAKRVYFNNGFFSIGSNGGLGNSPSLYTPASDYTDLETGVTRKETALRHLAAYIYSIFKNVHRMKDYSCIMELHLNEIRAVLQKGEFVLPDDAGELEFYRELIPGLLQCVKASIDALPKGRGFMHSSAFIPEHYERLYNQIREMIEEYKVVIFFGGGGGG